MKPSLSGILILEPFDFNPNVLKQLINMSDVVYLGIEDTRDFNKVELIFTRLNYYIDDVLIKKFPNLKYILSPTTGLTHIDTSVVTNTDLQITTLKNHTSKLSGITSTPELAWGLFINLVRKISVSYESVKDGFWDRDKFKGTQLRGMNIGIIGYGRIGRQLSVYANAFGCDVAWYDVSIGNIKDQTDSRFSNLSDIAKYSDAIFVCASYSMGDLFIIDDIFLNKVTNRPYIVNIARANLVDEFALCSALEANKIRGVASDVLTGEDIGNISKSPLLLRAQKYNDVLITPHIGGCTLEAMQLTEQFTFDIFLKELTYYAS